MHIRIITDSASDITDRSRPGLTVLPMTITFGDEAYQDGVDLTHRQFYEKLVEGDALPVTSQIPPFQFQEAIDDALKTDEKVIVITMSSKLSGTWQSAVMAADTCPGRVFVVDSENVTVGERILVEYALRLAEQGLSAPEVAAELETLKKKIHLVALLDTLEYLKRGGRVSKATAFAGVLLSIKPVVAVTNGEVAILGKARGSKQANNLIAEQVRAAGEIDFGKPYFLGYTGLSDALVRKYAEDNAALWKSGADQLPIGTVGGTIGTHAGPGAIVVAWVSK